MPTRRKWCVGSGGAGGEAAGGEAAAAAGGEKAGAAAGEWTLCFICRPRATHCEQEAALCDTR